MLAARIISTMRAAEVIGPSANHRCGFGGPRQRQSRFGSKAVIQSASAQRPLCANSGHSYECERSEIFVHPIYAPDGSFLQSERYPNTTATASGEAPPSMNTRSPGIRIHSNVRASGVAV